MTDEEWYGNTPTYTAQPSGGGGGGGGGGKTDGGKKKSKKCGTWDVVCKGKKAVTATVNFVDEHKAVIAGIAVGVAVGLGCGALIGWTGAGTAVLMADGSKKAIEKVGVGDLVLATGPGDGTIALPVTATITGTGDRELVRITVETGGADGPATIVATDNHPFWVPSAGGWVEAGHLLPGQWLQTSAGTWVQIGSVHRGVQPGVTTFNFTVAVSHTYFVLVDRTPVLVHNCPELADAAAKLPKDWPRRSTGILDVGIDQIPLSSGPGGPSNLVANLAGRTAQNFDHVETHAAAFLRSNLHLRKAVLYVQNAKNVMCGGCADNLRTMLPKDVKLWVYVNGKPWGTFTGNSL
jgi:hypothetical protein